MEDALAKGLSDVLDKSAATPSPREPILKPLPTQGEAPRTPTPIRQLVPAADATLAELSDQLVKVENINRALREKVQSEKMALLADHDRKWTDTQHKYNRMLHDATVRIENEREDTLRALKTAFQTKSQEIDKIASRIIDQTDH